MVGIVCYLPSQSSWPSCLTEQPSHLPGVMTGWISFLPSLPSKLAGLPSLPRYLAGLPGYLAQWRRQGRQGAAVD